MSRRRFCRPPSLALPGLGSVDAQGALPPEPPTGGRAAPRTPPSVNRRHLALVLPALPNAASLEGLALWALRFSPLVAMEGKDALLIDVAGVAHLFGGEAALLDLAVKGLGRLGLAAIGVIADSPAAALALARAGQAGLVVPPGGDAAATEGLNIRFLPVDPEVISALARLGLWRVGEVRRQPRAPLARRFGLALLRALDAMAGEVAVPISPIRPPPEFEVVREVLDPLVTREAIDTALAGLLQALCRRLSENGRGARRVVLRAHRVDGGVQELAVGTGFASRDPAHLGRLFTERLDRLAPGFGFERLALGAEVTEPLSGLQGGFTGGALRREELEQLFDRLAQRLTLWRLAPTASHWPEREVMRVAATAELVVPEGWPRRPRPVRLLHRPQEVGAMALLPDAPPSLLRIGQASHRVRAAEGPERLEPEWWRDPPGRKARDYYRVELASGARLWVCRVGFGAEARWFIHGHL